MCIYCEGMLCCMLFIVKAIKYTLWCLATNLLKPCLLQLVSLFLRDLARFPQEVGTGLKPRSVEHF